MFFHNRLPAVPDHHQDGRLVGHLRNAAPLQRT